jgi:hypothetical protein
MKTLSLSLCSSSTDLDKANMWKGKIKPEFGGVA